MFMNTLPEMIGIDETSIFCGIAPQNDWIHNEQVRVSGKNHTIYEYTTKYDFLWCKVDYVASPLTMIGPIVSRYGFQAINSIDLIKWPLHVYS